MRREFSSIAGRNVHSAASRSSRESGSCGFECDPGGLLLAREGREEGGGEATRPSPCFFGVCFALGGTTGGGVVLLLLLSCKWSLVLLPRGVFTLGDGEEGFLSDEDEVQGAAIFSGVRFAATLPTAGVLSLVFFGFGVAETAVGLDEGGLAECSG